MSPAIFSDDPPNQTVSLPKTAPKYQAGQCVVLPPQASWEKPIILRIEMVDRDAGMYLIRTAPASLYREQDGFTADAETIDKHKPTTCPKKG